MDFCIEADELRKALKDIEEAENNGFMYCLSVFKFTEIGVSLDQNRAGYSDMIEKAHPTDGNFNWGRFQVVTKYNKFINGKLYSIKGADNE